MAETTENTTRLDSLLSNLGFCARRKIEQFLSDNNVTINDQKVTEAGIRVNPKTDFLKVNGKVVFLETEKKLVYLLLNKPKGVLSSAAPNARRKTVLSFLPPKTPRVYPVGRLDEQSTGLILLTNDGDLAHKFTHPKSQIPKTYLVWVVGSPSEKRLIPLREGIRLKEGKIQPAELKILKKSPKRTLIEVILNEGNNHQIRQMFERVHLPIVELKQVAIGQSLELKHLGLGKVHELTKEEINNLKKEVEIKEKEFTQNT